MGYAQEDASLNRLEMPRPQSTSSLRSGALRKRLLLERCLAHGSISHEVRWTEYSTRDVARPEPGAVHRCHCRSMTEETAPPRRHTREREKGQDGSEAEAGIEQGAARHRTDDTAEPPNPQHPGHSRSASARRIERRGQHRHRGQCAGQENASQEYQIGQCIDTFQVRPVARTTTGRENETRPTTREAFTLSISHPQTRGPTPAPQRKKRRHHRRLLQREPGLAHQGRHPARSAGSTRPAP